MEPDTPLLIALLPQPIELTRAQAGWYRVPLEQAPAALTGARALAFYQPGSFGVAHRWQVAWWGSVLAVERCLRRELIPEEPRHRRAGEPYLVVRLAPLVPVAPAKRAARGRRLLFVPTTWGDFQAAPTLDDLLDRAPRPIQDDPLFQIIQDQVADKGGIPDPAAPHQRRLFEPIDLFYNALDW